MKADRIPNALDDEGPWDGTERRTEMRETNGASRLDAPTLEWVRWLVAWLPEPLASIAVLGRPAQTDEDRATVIAVASRARSALASRAPFEPSDPRITVPADELRAIGDRDDIQVTFSPHQWEPAVVDLTKVLSVQPMVKLSGLGERVASVSPETLLDLCVPPREEHKVAVGNDADGRGLTFSTRNPNLRILGTSVGEVEPMPGQKHIAATILVGGLQSYLQVAEYRGRFFVRDGYHRAVALLRRGISLVPCVFIHARSLQELTPNGGLFTDDILFSERPPLLTDFLDPNVTFTARRPSLRRVLRVRADEFTVQ